MCGIVGLCGYASDGDRLAQHLERMNASQVHRGPDDHGVFTDPDAAVALAMQRLAIIDVAGGAQPMVSADGRYALVFNGEIFNAPALRADLEAAGVAFVSDHSDTEVLLRLLMRDGAAALPHLNGMFALALYDRTAGTLLLARDRMGIKPLYWTAESGRLAFASELKSLIDLPWLRREIDRQSLYHYLTLQFVPGADSILAGVHRLQPGHSLTWDVAARQGHVERWWRPVHRPDDTVAPGDWPALVRETLAGAVKGWSQSDVPIACSLSGGLDSSAIVGLLAETGGRVQTVSLGFTGAGEADWNELTHARLVAQRYGTDHSEIVLEPEALLDDLTAMVYSLDEPYGGGLPSWSVFERMSRTVKVAMTGSGGDELFGNYGRWTALEGGRLARIAGPRRANGVDMARFTRDFTDRYFYFPDADKRAVLADAGAGMTTTTEWLFGHYDATPSPNVRDRVAAIDFTTQLPDEFLAMTDRFSMAHSLEARTPFLDNAMVDLALRIPAAARTRPTDLKGLLRRAVAPLLPEPLLTAPKRGFVIPLGAWMRGRLRPVVERLLAPERLAEQGLFTATLHGRWVRPHLSGEADHTRTVWAALMFQLWHRRFIEGAVGLPAAAPAEALAEL